MDADVSVLTEIPCFHCLFWNPNHCNPGKCEKLTQWLFEQIKEHSQDKNEISAVIPQTKTAKSI